MTATVLDLDPDLGLLEAFDFDDVVTCPCGAPATQLEVHTCGHSLAVCERCAVLTQIQMRHYLLRGGHAECRTCRAWLGLEDVAWRPL